MQQLQAKVVKVLPLTTYGKENKQKGGIVVETSGKYPKKVMFTAFGNALSKLDGVKQGDDVTVDFNVESREWQDKWFTDAVLLNIVANGSAQPAKEEFRVPDNKQFANDLPF